MILILSWVASACTVLCMHLLARKKIGGWWSQLAGSILWITYAALSGTFWALAPINTLMLYYAIEGLYKWRK